MLRDGSSSGTALPDLSRWTEALRAWCRERGLWWATSLTAHLLILSIAMLVLGVVYVAPRRDGAAPAFDASRLDPTIISDLEKFDPGEIVLEPKDLAMGTPSVDKTSLEQGMLSDASVPSLPDVSSAGDFVSGGAATSLGIPLQTLRATFAGSDPRGAKSGSTNNPGSGFSWRTTGRLGRPKGSGNTIVCDRAVAAALQWLARHQSPDGRWSLPAYSARCVGPACSGPGSVDSDAAATALAILPFLGAGQTHRARGPYRQNIQRGLYWLTSHQTPNGDLSAGGPQQMYAHGLATIALCEAHGLSGDPSIGMAAQQAIQFIESAQHLETGGWRYRPRESGDTSVLGWQVMALKSAQMAGLTVSTQTLARARHWLKLAGAGAGQFAYQAGGGAGTPAVSSVGLLCTQYLGAPRNDPTLQAGMAFLLANLPNPARRDIYYWYYATQVMHNAQGAEWDTWNRAMRRILVESQCKTGCAAGSWDAAAPVQDAWGKQGGRIMLTSLSCLTLEVYYRYLPLYKLDGAKN